MRTAVGAPDPGDFERNQPHNIFNDRRIGDRAKNRAVGENFSNPSQGIKKRREYPPKNNSPKLQLNPLPLKWK